MQPEVIKREEVRHRADAPKLGRLTPRALGLAFFGVCLILVIAAYAFTRPLEDFVEYWTAGHLLLTHRNPYSLVEVYRFEQALGWHQPIPLIALNPPWTLPLFIPLGIMHSYALAWLAWVAMLTSATVYSSRLLMDIYFGDIALPEISDTAFYRSLFALTFYPVLLSLKFAQTSAIVLLGITAFLLLERKQKPTLAAGLLGLTWIKPNLVYLVWLALLLWSLRQRRWKPLVAPLMLIAVLLGIALCIDPHVIREYRSLASSSLLTLFVPGIAGALRTLFKQHTLLWLQLLPPILGVVWFSFYWHKHRDHWNWVERMPALVSASILTTAYGWLFDQILLIVPIVALASTYAKRVGHLPRSQVVLYTALNIALILLAMASSPWSFVPAPIVVALLLYRQARATHAISPGMGYDFVGDAS